MFQITASVKHDVPPGNTRLPPLLPLPGDCRKPCLRAASFCEFCIYKHCKQIENLKNKHKNFLPRYETKISGPLILMSLSRMTCLSGTPTNLGPCLASYLFLCSFLYASVSMRRDITSYCRSYEAKTKSVLQRAPIRRVDHTLLLVDKLHLSVPDLLSDTIGEHNLLHVVAELQCEHKVNIYIYFVLNHIFHSSFWIPIVTAFSLLKMMSHNIDLKYWMAESFTDLCSLCLC